MAISVFFEGFRKQWRSYKEMSKAADGWAEAENLKNWLWDGPQTDRRTNRKVVFRVACPRLKMCSSSARQPSASISSLRLGRRVTFCPLYCSPPPWFPSASLIRLIIDGLTVPNLSHHQERHFCKALSFFLEWLTKQILPTESWQGHEKGGAGREGWCAAPFYYGKIR